MADDGEQRGVSNVDKSLDSFSTSLDNAQNTPENELIDNIEAIDTFSEESVERKDSFCEEKTVTTLERTDDFEDEKVTAAVDFCFKDDVDSFRETKNDEEEKVSENEMAKGLACSDSEDVYKSAVEEVNVDDEVFFSTTHHVPEVQLEKTEFRHRHLREKEENVPKSSEFESNVNFENFEHNREIDSVRDDGPSSGNQKQSQKQSNSKYDTYWVSNTPIYGAPIAFFASKSLQR